MSKSLQLIAPTLVKLTKDHSYDGHAYKKGDILAVENHQAERMVERKVAEAYDGEDHPANPYVEASDKVKAKAAASKDEDAAEPKPARAAKPAADASKVSNTNTEVTQKGADN